VNVDGHREIRGLQVTTSKDGAGWLGYFRDLTAHGLSGVKLVTPTRTRGSPRRSRRACPGRPDSVAGPHCAASLMSTTPKSSWGWVVALLRSVYDKRDAAAVHARFKRVVDALAGKIPEIAKHLERARADILACTALPRELRHQVWSNNPNEHLIREIRRRSDVVGIFPERPSIARLIGAVLLEQHDDWAEGRP
jgi:transposase-like protein